MIVFRPERMRYRGPVEAERLNRALRYAAADGERTRRKLARIETELADQAGQALRRLFGLLSHDLKRGR